MLHLAQLKALHAVARTGSVSAAATDLCVTTSAISQRLAKLERDVGQPLLERKGRSVQLTDTASLLANHAARILSAVDEAEAALEDHRGAVIGHLTVAAFSSAARGLFPDALGMLRDMYPGLRVEANEMEPDMSIAALVRGDIDVAVVQDWLDFPLEVPDGLLRADLLDDVMDIALPANHPFAHRPVIEFDDLLDEPWVSWPSRSVCHNWLLYMFRSRGVAPNILHTAAEYATQFALVAAGLGIAAAPRLGRGTVPCGVQMAALLPAPTRHVYTLWRAESARRPTLSATVDALRAAAKSQR